MLTQRTIFWVVLTLFSLPSYSAEKQRPPLLDGDVLSQVKLSSLMEDLRPDTLVQRGKNSYYLFSFHAPTAPVSGFTYVKFEGKKFQRHIEDLNCFAAERASRQAKASKNAPADLGAKAKRRRSSAEAAPSLSCKPTNYLLGKSYLKYAFDQPVGYLVLQVTLADKKNYLTGIGTLHPFYTWVEDFAWGSTQNPMLSEEIREVEDWLRQSFSQAQPSFEAFCINKKEVLLPKTTHPSLAEIGVLSAIGGGSTILDFLEAHAVREQFTGILISSLKTAVSFYIYKQYLPIASPSARHLRFGTTEAQVMPYYCHPISSVEFVTYNDASTFLVKKLPLQPLMSSKSEEEEEPVSPRLRKKPLSTNGKFR